MAKNKNNTDTMRELRDWLVTKCRFPDFGNHTDCSPSKAGSSTQGNGSGQQQYKSYMVTPRTIPQFVIPGSNDSSRQPSIGSNDDLLSHSSGEPSVASWSASTSPGVSPRSSFSALAAPELNINRVRSAPVSPRRDSHGFLKDFGIRSMTNLPHVHVEHTGKNTLPNPQDVRRLSNSKDHFSLVAEPKCTPRKGSLTIPGQDTRHRNRKIHRSSHEFAPKYERSVSSDRLHVNQASGAYSGLYTGLTDMNEYLPLKESFRRSKRYYRRRSSLATADVVRLLYHRSCGDGNGNGNGNGFSSDGSPPANRHRKQLAPIDPLQDKRHSSPEVVVTGVQNDSGDRLHPGRDKVRSNSLANMKCSNSSIDAQQSGVPAKSETERGEIKFSFQYFPATKRLKVIVIRLEGLKFPEKPDLVLNPFIKLCLMPGKIQKQTSDPVRQTNAPVMNKEYFFTDLNLEEMKTLRLRIRTFHKPHHLKLPEYLGEVNVPLSNYDLLMENRVWNDLHFKPYKKDLGHLQLELLLESRQARIIVGVIQARGLPSQHLTGAPDPYVHVAIWQFGQAVGQFQTSVKKNNTAPLFNETFNFEINIRSKALSHTKLVLSVFDRDRLRSDPLIGQVIMGQGATEESVIEHWDEAMVGNGRKICRWHYIMEKGETND